MSLLSLLFFLFLFKCSHSDVITLDLLWKTCQQRKIHTSKQKCINAWVSDGTRLIWLFVMGVVFQVGIRRQSVVANTQWWWKDKPLHGAWFTGNHCLLWIYPSTSHTDFLKCKFTPTGTLVLPAPSFTAQILCKLLLTSSHTSRRPYQWSLMVNCLLGILTSVLYDCLWWQDLICFNKEW